MAHNHTKNARLVAVLRGLCEAGLADDQMICHDGGYRFEGDFMSMEDGLEDAPIVDDATYGELLREGYIEELDTTAGRAGGFRVTDHGRRVAFSEGV